MIPFHHHQQELRMTDVYVCPEDVLDPDDPEYHDHMETMEAVGPMLRNPDGSVMELIPACRHVLEHGCSNAQGQILDAFSASAIVQVYDSLSAENRTKFARRARKVPPAAMADIVWKVLKKAGA